MAAQASEKILDVEECIERPTQTCWGLQMVRLKAMIWGSLNEMRFLLSLLLPMVRVMRQKGRRERDVQRSLVVEGDVREVLLDGNMMGEADGDLLGDGRWGL